MSPRRFHIRESALLARQGCFRIRESVLLAPFGTMLLVAQDVELVGLALLWLEVD